MFSGWDLHCESWHTAWQMWGRRLDSASALTSSRPLTADPLSYEMTSFPSLGWIHTARKVLGCYLVPNWLVFSADLRWRKASLSMTEMKYIPWAGIWTALWKWNIPRPSPIAENLVSCPPWRAWEDLSGLWEECPFVHLLGTYVNELSSCIDAFNIM